MTVTDAAPTHHPVVVEHQEHRAADVQLRVADKITKFAGSMMFVYVHIVLFVAWMLVVVRGATLSCRRIAVNQPFSRQRGRAWC